MLKYLKLIGPILLRGGESGKEGGKALVIDADVYLRPKIFQKCATLAHHQSKYVRARAQTQVCHVTAFLQNKHARAHAQPLTFLPVFLGVFRRLVSL